MAPYRDGAWLTKRMTCENVTIKGDKGTPITAYVARPSGPGLFPGVVLVHHLPGWSEFYIETTRRFAHHGFLAICANPSARAEAATASIVSRASGWNSTTASIASSHGRCSKRLRAGRQAGVDHGDRAAGVAGALGGEKRNGGSDLLRGGGAFERQRL
jgi:hypothetical protein